MVNVRVLAVSAVVVIAALVIVLWLTGDSPEKQVRRQLAQLEELVGKATSEAPLAAAARARKIGSLFAETCEIATDVDFLTGTVSPTDVAQKAMYGRGQFAKLSLRFHDLQIEFPSDDTAAVTLSATLQGTLTAGERVHDAQELECSLRNTDGDWRFTSLKIVEILRR